ncbi:MAG TPA: alpha-amylase family glycosyl hydrolase [Pseudonocardiaceae bacterium]|jgi:alpha-glucosidase
MTERDWWRDAVIYQIYPRSFADTNGDGIGDLRGIIDRLDHLNDGTPRSLGVSALWLSPFYPSPLADFGYDISDYQAVDPVYGRLADFDELLGRAHERGIRVLVDLVMNHTSDQHPWFLAARSDRRNPKRDWYIWADGQPDGRPPNNWLSAFEKCGAGWTEDTATGQFYLHSFTPEQPDLNWRNPEVRAAMREVWRFWLDRGVDGFRVDVAHRLLKDAQLRDNPEEIAYARRHLSHPTLRQRNLDLPEVHEVLADLRTTVDGYGARVVLGEVPISDDARLADYFGGDGMHTVFHIGFWEQPWQASAFRATVDSLAARMRPGALPTYAIATHDIARTVTRYGSADRARVVALMMFTLRGVPCVYYGEEIGMADGEVPIDEVLDIDGRDGARVPMQWDATGAGFSAVAPWLPFGTGQERVNVAAQDTDPDSLLSFYRRAIWYRRGSEVLRRGEYRSLDTPDPVFAYLREPGLLVALNFAAEPVTVRLPELAATGRIVLATRQDREGTEVNPRDLWLRPDEGIVVRIGGFPCPG